MWMSSKTYGEEWKREQEKHKIEELQKEAEWGSDGKRDAEEKLIIFQSGLLDS